MTYRQHLAPVSGWTPGPDLLEVFQSRPWECLGG